MSDTLEESRGRWVQRVLGVTVARRGTPPAFGAGTPVRLAPADPHSPIGQAAALAMQPGRPAIGPGLSGGTAPETARSGRPTGPKSSFAGPGGKKIEITVGSDGRVSFATPPPPVRQITLSGGGGKGAALAGAVAALEASGTLKDVTMLNGASVGSMSAALIAAGITSKDFEDISDDPTTGGRISEGRSKAGLLADALVGDRLNGKAVEDIVREGMGESIRKRIDAYVKSGTGKPEDIAAAQAIAEKTLHGGGVTFGDLRTLSKFVPGVKELNISATMMGDDTASPGKIKDGKPQLMMFGADTEPDLDVALAVHASAALPPVFDPVDIRLESLGGVTARFEDGGVLNNAPTASSVGAKRQLDPVPESGDLTFVFDDANAQALLKGEATPDRERMNDMFAKADFSAAQYAEDRALADNPADVVVVPLIFTAPNNKKKDFSSLWGGTLAMNMALADKQGLQQQTALATLRSLDRRKLPETREFESTTQMLDCIPRDDLVSLVNGGFAGAKEELAFRDAVTDAVARLPQIAQDAKAEDLKSGKLRAALDALDALAGADKDRQGFVARELNRGGIDTLLDLARKSGDQGLPVLQAGVAVEESLRANAVARTVLREVVYPKLVRVKPKGVDGTVLVQMDNTLRKALMPEEVNAGARHRHRTFRDADGPAQTAARREVCGRAHAIQDGRLTCRPPRRNACPSSTVRAR